MGIKTSNSYLKSFKHFCSWLENDGRVPKKKNPVEHLSIINADTDVRRKRRAMSAEEFTWLIQSAISGSDIQCVSGTERANIYMVAVWTGLRRSELASLTIGSIDLESDPPVVKVKAGYSKRRRNEIIPFHSVVAEQLKAWLKTKKNATPSDSLFNLRTKSGGLRKTSKMMRLDLQRARAAWIKEAKTKEEQIKREQSDFLCYQDENGLYADFHANRHTFITNLAKAGIYPKLAQAMARHSDVNLTMGIYSHVSVEEQAKAINSLPAPPSLSESLSKAQDSIKANEAAVSEVEEGKEEAVQKTDSQPLHPKAGRIIAPLVALENDFECPQVTFDDISCPSAPSDTSFQKPLPQKDLVIFCQALTSDDVSAPRRTRRG